MSLQEVLEGRFFEKEDRMQFLDTFELAERWKTTRGNLANKRYRGEAPEFIKIGKKILYPIDVVEGIENEKLRGANVNPANV